MCRFVIDADMGNEIAAKIMQVIIPITAFPKTKANAGINAPKNNVTINAITPIKETARRSAADVHKAPLKNALDA